MFNHKLFGVLGFFLVFFSVLGGCDNTSTPSANKKAATPHKVEVAVAAIQDLQQDYRFTASLEPERLVKLFTQEEGLLKNLPYYPGDRVKSDDVIAVLDDTLIRTQLDKARASLSQVQVDLRRVENLLPRKLASEEEVARSKTAVALARSDVKQYETRLAHTRIRAPFDGVISERLAESGDVINLQQQVATLEDDSALKAVVNVSELLLPQIKPADKVKLSIDALGSQVFTASITRIYPTIDSATRQGRVEVSLSPVPPQARPGQLCRITFSIHAPQRLVVPNSAVRIDQRGDSVYRVSDNHAQQIKVDTGLQTDTSTEILSDLSAGDTVITRGFFGLKPDSPLQVIKPE